jgi:hypothetical protein
VREYEIGSEAWMRERIERGLDPGEEDRPEDPRLRRLEVELAPNGQRRDGYSPWSASNVDKPGLGVQLR